MEKKRVKIVPMIKEKSSNNMEDYEEIREIKKVFSGHFSNFINHVTLSEIPARTYVAYPVLTERASFIKIIETIIIPYVKESYPSLFFDSTIDGIFNSEESKEVVEEVVEIKMDKGGRIALYYPKLKSLVTTDWSHNMEAIKITKLIKPTIIEIMESHGHNEKTILKKKNKTDKEKIIVGCDPEFEVVDLTDLKIKHAEDVAYESNRTVIKGCEKYDEIGIDGAGAPLEFRPKPGSPKEVSEYLNKLFDKFNKGMPNHALAVSGHQHAIGGHIHIGLGYRCCPPKELLTLLDDFIGSKTINLSGSARGSYKYLSACEAKSYGFEYRTPPAIIFYNQKLTEIFLKLARNLVWKFKNTSSFIEYNNPPSPEDYMKIGSLTSKEVIYLNETLNELTEKVNTGGVLIAAWGSSTKKVETLVTKPDIPPEFLFTDEWDNDIRNDLATYLLKKYTSGGAKIRLFGLKKERELKSNFSVSGWGIVSMTYSNSKVIRENNNEYVMFGLPHAFRTNNETYGKYKEQVKNVINYLIQSNKKTNKILI
jgi:hypothetical protein